MGGKGCRGKGGQAKLTNSEIPGSAHECDSWHYIYVCVCVLLIKTFRVLVQSLWHFVYFLFVPLVSQYIVHQLLLYCNFKSSIKIYHTCLACSFCDEYIWHNIVHITYTCLVVWASECPDVKNYKWWLNPVWHRMLYVWTHMATVGVKGLILVLSAVDWTIATGY